MKEPMDSRNQMDQDLNGAGQLQIAQMVRDLPEDVPSMAWRSALSARIATESVRIERKRRFGWIWRPASGLALASALAVALIVRPGSMPAPSESQSAQRSPQLEQMLVQEYQTSSLAMDAASDGLAAPEANYEKAPRVEDDPILADFFNL